MAFVASFSRWILPLLALFIVLLCGRSLVHGNKKVGTLGFLVNTANGDKIPLTSFETSIGRSRACDIVLGYSTVSRFHAVIVKRGGKWLVFDTHSKTGTLVNKETLDNVYLRGFEIRSGDTVTFGNAVFSFLENEEEDIDEEEIIKKNPTLLESDSVFNTGDIILPKEFVTGYYLENCITKERVNIDMYENVLLGRSDDALIRINSPTVSRAHALISRQKRGWIIEDLDSAAGTLLNGQPVTECMPIKSGDIIEICGFTIKFAKKK